MSVISNHFVFLLGSAEFCQGNSSELHCTSLLRIISCSVARDNHLTTFQVQSIATSISGEWMHVINIQSREYLIISRTNEECLKQPSQDVLKTHISSQASKHVIDRSIHTYKVAVLGQPEPRGSVGRWGGCVAVRWRWAWRCGGSGRGGVFGGGAPNTRPHKPTTHPQRPALPLGDLFFLNKTLLSRVWLAQTPPPYMSVWVWGGKAGSPKAAQLRPESPKFAPTPPQPMGKTAAAQPPPHLEKGAGWVHTGMDKPTRSTPQVPSDKPLRLEEQILNQITEQDWPREGLEDFPWVFDKELWRLVTEKETEARGRRGGIWLTKSSTSERSGRAKQSWTRLRACHEDVLFDALWDKVERQMEWEMDKINEAGLQDAIERNVEYCMWFAQIVKLVKILAIVNHPCPPV